MEEEDNDLQLQLMDDEDATTSIAFSIDLYCHEEPLQVSTPPSMTPGSARGGRSHNGGDAADHQQQQAAVLHELDDDDSSLVVMADYVARQRCYAPSRGYLDHLLGLSSSLLPEEDVDGVVSLSYARSRGVHYIVYAFGRLGLAAATAFNAVNYLDRFLAMNRHLQRWETWMVELVSLACLSIACKLDEVNIPSLHQLQLQMEEVMSHSFRPATIRDMELTLLKALQWRIACVTPFSFLQLLVVATTSCTAAAAAASSRCTRLLIRSLSETSLLRFDPSVIASSALRCVVLQQNYHRKATTAADVSGAGAHISSSFFLRPEYCPSSGEKDADDECLRTMKALYASLDNWSNNNHDQMMMYSDQQRSPPTSEIPFGIGTGANRSAVISRRRLFGTSMPHQEDEDSVPPDTDTQEMAE